MELTVEKLIYGGDGLGRVEGQVVMTPFVLAGERIEASPEEEHASFMRAKLERVIAPAAERVEPPCPYFGRCGGCHYQHADYKTQLETKKTILRETLQRVGKIDDAGDIQIICGEPWGYRNRAQLRIQNGELGYLEMRSHTLCPIDRCPISSPKINECIAALRRMLRDRRWPVFLSSLEIFTNESDVQLNVLETSRPLAKHFFDWCAAEIPGVVSESLDYGEYRVSRRSFFQVNRLLIDQMINCVTGDTQGETALDLYAGVGLFSLPLARRFRSVTAIESGRTAVADLRHNAERAGLNIESVVADVGDYLQELGQTPDFVLADPPRSGLGKAVVRQLGEIKPPRLTILACDPATLARDLSGLLQAGYRLDRLTMIDLFPQTFHIECAAALSLEL